MRVIYVLALLLGGGTQVACYSYYPVTARVQNLSTHQPIPRAKVYVRYEVLPLTQFLKLGQPSCDHGTTNSDGLTKLRVADDTTPYLRVQAPHFHDVEVRCPAQTYANITPLIIIELNPLPQSPH